MTESSNTVDAFINAIVDGLIKHEKFNEHLENVATDFVGRDSFTDDHLHEQIENWMTNNFNFNDFGFDISDHSYELDGMIDTQVQYLAEEGKIKEWLGNSDDSDTSFNERVFEALDDEEIKRRLFYEVVEFGSKAIRCFKYGIAEGKEET
tara:strand:- start:92 stop:541 length:450 start_codon:yes stop_codon:yes gene_type:complete